MAQNVPNLSMKIYRRSYRVQRSILPTKEIGRRRGPVVRLLGLDAVAPGSNLVLTSGQDLFPVVPDSTLPRFVNSQLLACCQLGP